MNQYGITPTGFLVKPLAQILQDKVDRAREMFGPDVDLRSTSALRKLLDVAAAEDHELWKEADRLFNAGFVSTATGAALDLLGEDVGVPRRLLPATGKVRFKLAGEQPGREYQLPLGTLVETAAVAGDPDTPVRFRTTALVKLSSKAKEAVTGVAAVNRGPKGNLASGAIVKVNDTYAKRNLNLGTATVAAANEEPTTGGDTPEDDETYRTLLLGRPRTLWTLEAVRSAVRAVDGVRDCRLFDPAGGVDVSLSRFSLFKFAQRTFGRQRLVVAPYFFEVLVAINPGVPWDSTDADTGVRQAVTAAIDEVRPVSIFPTVRMANDVLIGIRAKVLVRPGHDPTAVAASIKDRLERRVNALGLGGGVLYSEVLCDCMAATGVVDVQQLHLRRCPARFGTITFGKSPRFQAAEIEAAVGENLALAPDEIAVFKIDARLIDLQVSDR